MFSDYRTHDTSAAITVHTGLTHRDAAARFRTLEAEATFGAEVRRARLATRALRRDQSSRRGASSGVQSTRAALAR